MISRIYSNLDLFYVNPSGNPEFDYLDKCDEYSLNIEVMLLKNEISIVENGKKSSIWLDDLDLQYFSEIINYREVYDINLLRSVDRVFKNSKL